MVKIFRKIKKALFLFFTSPKEFWKKLSLFIKFIQPLPKKPITKRIHGVLFRMDFAYDPDIKDMYYGIYQRSTINVMKKFLKKGDTFFDIGANIGYLSAIALGLVGENGEVHSFEPVKEYYLQLKNMADMNARYKIILNHCAVGDVEGTAKISVPKASPAGSLGTSSAPGALGWGSIVPKDSEQNEIRDFFEVPIIQLDNYIKQRNIKKISMIKIDTEGFEFPVLRGLTNYLSVTENLPVILCEIMPGAYPKLNSSLDELASYLAKYDYTILREDHLDEVLDVTKINKLENAVLLPLCLLK